jgi:hypothetical protein
MLSVKDISSPANSNASRRRFLGTGIKLAALSALLLPLQKALGNSSSFITDHAQKLGQSIQKAFFADKLILNTKTKVVHLPTEKIFTHYQDIAVKNQKVIELGTWETQLKTPFHFNKEKSGIILELLALQKLATGVNDKNLVATTKILAMTFSPAYSDSNKYNFRIHDFLMQTIALNNGIPVTQKWNEFQLATARINYNTEFKLPKRMSWLKTQTEFNNQVNYIIKNKTTYTDRLKQRAVKYKL